MKPKNFPTRKLRRQVGAYKRLFTDGVLLKQSHEAFVLHGKLPNRPLHFLTLPPTDIRIRMGREARNG
jgi:hypothetical protein